MLARGPAARMSSRAAIRARSSARSPCLSTAPWSSYTSIETKISGSVTSCATSKLITPGTLRLAADRSANFLRASSIFCGYTFPDTRKIIMRRAFSPYDVSWLRSLQFCPYDFPACVLREIPIPFIADSFHQQQSPAALRVSAYAHTCWWLRAGIPDENHDPCLIREQPQPQWGDALRGP